MNFQTQSLLQQCRNDLIEINASFAKWGRIEVVFAKLKPIIEISSPIHMKQFEELDRVQWNRTRLVEVRFDEFNVQSNHDDVAAAIRQNEYIAKITVEKVVAFLDSIITLSQLTPNQSTMSAEEMEKADSAINSVFVVHGHDVAMRQSVARTLEKLGLKPIILHEQPNKGKTVIEKFERDADVGFAVVLLSPDDMGYLKNDGAKQAKPRARQNVILELGYFVGKLGRDNVMALKKGDDLEVPSDLSGVVYTPFDDHDGWKGKLVKELKAAGYKVSADDL